MQRRQFLINLALAGPALSLAGWAASLTLKAEAEVGKLAQPDLLDVDPLGPRVVVGCGMGKPNSSILLLERQSGKELWSISIRGLRDCYFCDQGRMLFVSTPDGWTLWDTLGYKPKAQVRIPSRAAGVSRNGATVIVCQAGTVKIFDLHGKLLDTFATSEQLDGYDRLAVSADGNHFALSNPTGFFLYDVSNRSNFGENTGTVAFRPDGKALVRQSQTGWLMGLAVETGVGLGQPVQSHTGGEVSFSSDGKYVLSQGVDEQGHHLAQIWTFPALEHVSSHTFSSSAGGEGVQSRLSGDGKLGFSWNSIGQIELWNASTGNLLTLAAPLKLPGALRRVMAGPNWLVGIGGPSGQGFYRGYSW